MVFDGDLHQHRIKQQELPFLVLDAGADQTIMVWAIARAWPSGVTASNQAKGAVGRPSTAGTCSRPGRTREEGDRAMANAPGGMHERRRWTDNVCCAPCGGHPGQASPSFILQWVSSAFTPVLRIAEADTLARMAWLFTTADARIKSHPRLRARYSHHDAPPIEQAQVAWPRLLYLHRTFLFLLDGPHVDTHRKGEAVIPDQDTVLMLID